VQRVVKLALEAPLELRMIEVARMKIEIINMYGNGGVFELDNDFDTLALGARGKIQQRMLVQAQLSEDPFEARIFNFGHRMIVK